MIAYLILIAVASADISFNITQSTDKIIVQEIGISLVNNTKVNDFLTNLHHRRCGSYDYESRNGEMVEYRPDILNTLSIVLDTSLQCNSVCAYYFDSYAKSQYGIASCRNRGPSIYQTYRVCVPDGYDINDCFDILEHVYGPYFITYRSWEYTEYFTNFVKSYHVFKQIQTKASREMHI